MTKLAPCVKVNVIRIAYFFACFLRHVGTLCESERAKECSLLCLHPSACKQCAIRIPPCANANTSPCSPHLACLLCSAFLCDGSADQVHDVCFYRHGAPTLPFCGFHVRKGSFGHFCRGHHHGHHRTCRFKWRCGSRAELLSLLHANLTLTCHSCKSQSHSFFMLISSLHVTLACQSHSTCLLSQICRTSNQGITRLLLSI